ncbi:hypothetical protein OROGR_016597 [Orobanche gracilis]
MAGSGDSFTFMASTLNGGTRPPDKPPDKGSEDVKVSFRDKVLGSKGSVPTRAEIDLIGKGLARVELLGGNRLLPSITFDEGVINEYSTEWRDALIISLIGKRLGYRIMREKLKFVWKLSGDFDMMDLDNGFFMVKFDREADREKVIEGGPWMVFDHYVAISNWSLDFDSTTASVKKAMVWIRLSGLNMFYYDKTFLLPIASAIGRPVKIDPNTMAYARGRFARICVEINLDQPVIGKVCVQGHWHKVEYEGLHVICSNCGCYGHVTRNCTVAKPTINNTVAVDSSKEGVHGGSQTVEEGDKAVINDNNNQPDSVQLVTPEIHGDWLVVTRKKRSGKGGKGFGTQNQGKHANVSNKFGVLDGSGFNSNKELFVENQKEGSSEFAAKIWLRKKRQRPNHSNNDDTHIKDLEVGHHTPNESGMFQVGAGPHVGQEGGVTEINDTKNSSGSQMAGKLVNSADSPISSVARGANVVKGGKGTYLHENEKQHPFGIRTMMPVEFISGNRMRFLEEDEPPDGGDTSGQHDDNLAGDSMQVQSDEDDVSSDGSDQNDEEDDTNMEN